jgi:NAD(P)-dependent dehydrogenase (short-subunit alcohol dehydrogenase family)
MSNERPFSGRSAVITGGGSGIGLECARLLVRDGATVVLMGRTQERLDEGSASLAADLVDGARVVTVAGDAAV